MDENTITRELYEAFAGGELDRWDAVIADDVFVNSPAGFDQRGLAGLKAFAGGFLELGKQIDLVDEHLALDDNGDGRGFITFNLQWKHDHDFFGLAPTGREGTSIETMLLTIRGDRIVRIDVADHTVDLPIYLWSRRWPNPHNINPEPLVVGARRDG
jgi:ketosteroid isomerase-like protein